MSAWQSLGVIVGLALVTLVCRSLFLLPDREVRMPEWLREGLRYAPLAALVAVVAPEIFMSQGQLVDVPWDPRICGAAAGLTWYAWRRSILGTIFLGTGTYLLMRWLLH